MQDQFNYRAGYKPASQVKQNDQLKQQQQWKPRPEPGRAKSEDTKPAENKPRESKPPGERGPFYIPKLLNQQVTVALINGRQLTGTLRGYNPYELLLEINPGELILVFKGSVIYLAEFKADLFQLPKIEAKAEPKVEIIWNDPEDDLKAPVEAAS